MNKENNCSCVVCQVEHDLLDSLRTQIARTHFQALARNYPVLNHFDSPADVIARLHEHEQVGAANHNAWNGILHALVNASTNGISDDLGQQLLLVAYMPAIHRVCWEICQRFPGLAPEDVAQQASVFFLENAKSPSMARQNGHLPIALVKYFRRRLFRWAFRETRLSLPLREMTADFPEPPTNKFEHALTLEKFLQQAKRDGLLSDAEFELLLKFKREGFGAKELAAEKDGSKTPNAMHHRLKRIVKRLRHAARDSQTTSAADVQTNSGDPEKYFPNNAANFPEEMSISKGDMGFSPELSRQMPNFEADVPCVAA